MKQLISVRAILRQGDKTLVIRRANGRQSILGKYELPGGKLGYGEQPDDALRRYIKQDIGLKVQSTKLFDVVTYIDHDDRDKQYTFILYLVQVDPGSRDIQLSSNYNNYEWQEFTGAKQDKLTESTKLLLGMTDQEHAISIQKKDNIDVKKSTSSVIIYSDGGSRGNPGPSASGFVILNTEQEVIHQGGEYLGVTTNNQAEYHGVRLGLEKALAMGAKTVDFRMDSLLVVNQLNGTYKIKNRELWPIYEAIKDLATHFDKVTFSHVRREFNQLADGMVNKILDAHAKDQSTV